MRHSKIRLVLLSSVLAISAISTSFGAWVFSKSVIKDASLPLTITSSSLVGSINVTGSASLTLSQGGVANKDDLTKTITLSWGNLMADYVSVNSPEETNLSRTYSLSLSGALADYVEFSSASSTFTDVSWTDSTVPTVIPTFSYKTGMKPTTQSAYDTMKTAIGTGADQITVTFTTTTTNQLLSPAYQSTINGGVATVVIENDNPFSVYFIFGRVMTWGNTIDHPENYKHQYIISGNDSLLKTANEIQSDAEDSIVSFSVDGITTFALEIGDTLFGFFRAQGYSDSPVTSCDYI